MTPGSKGHDPAGSQDRVTLQAAPKLAAELETLCCHASLGLAGAWAEDLQKFCASTSLGLASTCAEGPRLSAGVAVSWGGLGGTRGTIQDFVWGALFYNCQVVRVPIMVTLC